MYESWRHIERPRFKNHPLCAFIFSRLPHTNRSQSMTAVEINNLVIFTLLPGFFFFFIWASGRAPSIREVLIEPLNALRLPPEVQLWIGSELNLPWIMTNYFSLHHLNTWSQITIPSVPLSLLHPCSNYRAIHSVDPPPPPNYPLPWSGRDPKGVLRKRVGGRRRLLQSFHDFMEVRSRGQIIVCSGEVTWRRRVEVEGIEGPGTSPTRGK